MRVFLDANVLFSASAAASITGRLVDRVEQVATLVTCELAIEEARRNVERKTPDNLERLKALTDRIETAPSLVFPLPVELVEKDRPILCAAIRSGCGLLATGDPRDFGHLYDQTIEGVTVVSLRRLAEWVVERTGGA